MSMADRTNELDESCGTTFSFVRKSLVKSLKNIRKDMRTIFAEFNALSRAQKEKDNMVILLDFAAGDSYVLVGIIQTLVENRVLSNIILICPQHLAFLGEWFPGIKKTITIPNFRSSPTLKFFYVILYGVNHLFNLKIIVIDTVIINFVKNLLKGEQMDFDFYQVAKGILKIENDVPISNPVMPGQATIKRVENMMNDLGLEKGNTVMLAPNANTAHKMPISVWELIRDRALNEGFKVVSNVGPGEEGVPNTIWISLSLEESFLAADYCGWIISIRSGFIDVLSSSKCRKTIIYVDCPSDRLFMKSTKHIFGEADEVIFRPNNSPDALLNEIFGPRHT